VHEGSVLSLCAWNGLLASAGSDGRTVVYDLSSARVIKVLKDHADSVLCVRFNEHFLATCSKGLSVHTFRVLPAWLNHRLLV
jgi:WD40 repeat protein